MQKGIVLQNSDRRFQERYSEFRVIAEDTFFTPWESDFEVAASKKVTVEVKTQTRKPLTETKVKVNVKKAITLTERDHVINLFKLLIKEGS